MTVQECIIALRNLILTGSENIASYLHAASTHYNQSLIKIIVLKSNCDRKLPAPARVHLMKFVRARNIKAEGTRAKSALRSKS